MDQNIASKDEKIEELEAEIERLIADVESRGKSIMTLENENERLRAELELWKNAARIQNLHTTTDFNMGVNEQTAREKFLSEPDNPDAKPTTFQERMMSGGSENEQQASAPRTEYGLCDRCNKYHDMIVTCENEQTARAANCPFCGATLEQRHDPQCGLAR